MSIGSEVVSGVTLTTYTITEGNNTTVTYYDTSSGVSEDVGQKVTNGTTGESSSSIMLKQSDGSFIQTETYLEKTGASEETRTYNFDYNSKFTGGTEVLDGITYKVNSDYSLASASANVTGAGFTEVTDTAGIAAGAIASSGKIYKKVNDYGNNDKEITYFDKDGCLAP